jgi:hypothetical protein
MCEAMSPPTPGDPIFITYKDGTTPFAVGDEFTESWGVYDVTYRVDENRGPGQLTGRTRLACTVRQVKVSVVD